MADEENNCGVFKYGTFCTLTFVVVFGTYTLCFYHLHTFPCLL